MKPLPILTVLEHSSILRKPSMEIESFTPEIAELVEHMAETMFMANGVGLAAPQIGRNLNIFVMRTEDGIARDTREYRSVINPYITLQQGQKVLGTEGCLSIPGVRGRVLRFPTISSVHWDATGTRQEMTLTDLQARIFQHEADHLLGILFTDRARELFPFPASTNSDSTSIPIFSTVK